MAYTPTQNPAIMHLITEVARVQKKIDRLEKIKRDFKLAIDSINRGTEKLDEDCGD